MKKRIPYCCCSLLHFKNNFQRFVTETKIYSPLSELLENNAVGEPLATDTDSLQHTVTPQLLQDQISIQLSRLGKNNYMCFHYMCI